MNLRTLAPFDLEDLLREVRGQTRRTFAQFSEQLGGQLMVPIKETLNPPLWEFGHLIWFEEFWIHRNPDRRLGLSYASEPDQHDPSCLGVHEAWYNSALLAHTDRWGPPPRSFDELMALLETQQEQTLQQLLQDRILEIEPGVAASDYFYRLALAHELMHLEAFMLTAQDLGLALSLDWVDADFSEQREAPASSSAVECIPSQRIRRSPAPGTFYFDNEAAGLSDALESFYISRRAVSLSDYAHFMAEGGYRDARFWSPDGWQWRLASQRTGPSGIEGLPQGQSGLSGQENYRRLVEGRWTEAHPSEPVSGVSYFEAEAWCRWAGHRLPTEGEWMAADGLVSSGLWEWTSSPFQPFEGFRPHPYGEYSAPWFGDHMVLKGHSWATHPALRDRLFRNFYRPHRGDLLSGFRTVRPG